MGGGSGPPRVSSFPSTVPQSLPQAGSCPEASQRCPLCEMHFAGACIGKVGEPRGQAEACSLGSLGCVTRALGFCAPAYGMGLVGGKMQWVNAWAWTHRPRCPLPCHLIPSRTWPMRQPRERMTEMWGQTECLTSQLGVLYQRSNQRPRPGGQPPAVLCPSPHSLRGGGFCCLQEPAGLLGDTERL